MDGLVVKRAYGFCRRPEFGSSTHIKWLTGAYNSSSKGSDATFGTPGTLRSCAPTPTHTLRPTAVNKRTDTDGGCCCWPYWAGLCTACGREVSFYRALSQGLTLNSTAICHSDWTNKMLPFLFASKHSKA